MSPALRASYCRPTPGTPLTTGEDGKIIDPNTFPATLPTDLEEGNTENEKALIKEALTNMSIIVIEPFEVDWYVSSFSFSINDMIKRLID